MGNSGSVSDQESLPLCPKSDRQTSDTNCNANSNAKSHADGHSDSNANSNTSLIDPKNENNNKRRHGAGSISESLSIVEENKSATLVASGGEQSSSEHQGLKHVRLLHGERSPRKSILRNARSDVNSAGNQEEARWTSRLSSRISDLRMRTIHSDPRLSVTSYGKNEEDRIVRNTASFPALTHLIRAFICCGFLSLPYAVKLAGLMVGTIVIIGTGIITSISVYLLIISAKKLQDRQRMSYLDYGQVRFSRQLVSTVRSRFGVVKRWPN